jgi:hypothetical protein
MLLSGNLDMSEDEMSVGESDSSDETLSGLDSGGDYGLDGFSFDEESPKKKGGKRKTDVDDVVSGQMMMKKKTGASTRPKKPPVKVVESKVSIASGAGSSSKKKTVVSLLDESTTTGEISSLAHMQQKLAQARLESVENEKTLNALKLQMQKYQMLKDLRQSSPSLMKSQVIQLFPALADIAKIVMVNEESD